MDLLLDLINKEKIDIYDIEIASITDQYLKVLQKIVVSSDELNDFIRMASLLVMMKARSLFDFYENDDEEILSKEELIQRLEEYKKLKALLPFFFEREQMGAIFARKLREDLSIYQEEAEMIIYQAELLHSLYHSLIFKKEKEDTFEPSHIMNRDEYSLEEIEKRIRQYMKLRKTFTFYDLVAKEKSNKSSIIAHFLSLLELSKQKSIRIIQEDKDLIVEVLRKGGEDHA